MPSFCQVYILEKIFFLLEIPFFVSDFPQKLPFFLSCQKSPSFCQVSLQKRPSFCQKSPSLLCVRFLSQKRPSICLISPSFCQVSLRNILLSVRNHLPSIRFPSEMSFLSEVVFFLSGLSPRKKTFFLSGIFFPLGFPQTRPSFYHLSEITLLLWGFSPRKRRSFCQKSPSLCQVSLRSTLLSVRNCLLSVGFLSQKTLSFCQKSPFYLVSIWILFFFPQKILEKKCKKLVDL